MSLFSSLQPPLAGKTAVVTGAGKGIGRAAALAFARAGASVAVLTRSDNDLPGLRRDLPENSVLVAGDVSDEETVRSFVDTVLTNLAGVDVLVNNASILTPKTPLLAVETADWDRSMAVNLRGPFLMMKHVLPSMIRRRTGLVINISSGAGRRVATNWGPYGVSKAALETLTKLAAAENADGGVRIVSVDPGGTRTRMRAAAFPDEDPSSLPTPEAVAAFLVNIAENAGDARLNGAALSFREWQDARR